MTAVPAGLQPTHQSQFSAVRSECHKLAARLGCICKSMEAPGGMHICYVWPARGFDWELVDPPVAGSWAGLRERLLLILNGDEGMRVLEARAGRSA